MSENLTAINAKVADISSNTELSKALNEENTLDAFLKTWAQQTPNALAFADAPNRSSFTLGEPIQLNYSRAYNITSSLSEQFIAHGLTPGDVIAIQLPNTVELPIVILAALKTGLIPCLIPISWRSFDIDKALQMVPAKALVTIGELTNHQYSKMMCELAFDHMSVPIRLWVGA